MVHKCYRSSVVPEPGQLIAGKYRLLRPLARGGMGSVWVAEHVELGVAVAVKFSTVAQALDPQAESRFKREARAAALLKSPHVVQIHDYGVDAGTPYIAMELLEGEDLSAYLAREERLSSTRALALLKQAGKALTRAHEHGVVHRDIKPSNLFLARSGDEETLKVLDFGIAQDHAPDQDSAAASGLILGSPAYMSPEQARAGLVDARSDVYSLAAIAFRMLTGVPPFNAEDPQALLLKLGSAPLPRASEICSDLAVEWDAFFERALARNVERRFATVGALLEAFEQIAPCAPSSVKRAVAGSVAPALGRASITESLVARPLAKSARARLLVPLGLALALALLAWRLLVPGRRENAPPPPRAHAPDQRVIAAPILVAQEPAVAPAETPSTVSPAPPRPKKTATKPAQSATTASSGAAPETAPVLDPVFGILVPARKTEQ